MTRPNQQAAFGLLLLLAALLPGLRQWLEADMARHMLLQFPLLVAAGGLLASSLPAHMRRAFAHCNAHGLTGLLLAMLVLALWMVPRALDEAVRSTAIDAIKAASLLTAGAALRLSWAPAGPVVQAFFLGSWAWMNATVGTLYLQSPLRLCNAYLSSDQNQAGRGLVVIALAGVAWWLSRPEVRWFLFSDQRRQPATNIDIAPDRL